MENRKELLDRMRAEREAQGLSYQDIVDITEKNNEAVSLSSVKRLFAEGSDIESFRLHQTICPVAHALSIEIEGQHETQKEKAKEKDSVSAIIDLKDEQITEYREKIRKLERSEKMYRTAFVIAVCILIALFSIDLCLGNFGWIRY